MKLNWTMKERSHHKEHFKYGSKSCSRRLDNIIWPCGKKPWLNTSFINVMKVKLAIWGELTNQFLNIMLRNYCFIKINSNMNYLNAIKFLKKKDFMLKSFYFGFKKKVITCGAPHWARRGGPGCWGGHSTPPPGPWWAKLMGWGWPHVLLCGGGSGWEM